MSKIDKKRVSQNFSRGSKTYDKYADVQKHMADKLESFMSETNEKFNILEIGCGTGIFSQKIIEKFPKSSITLLDISPSMVEAARGKLGDNPKIKFIAEDIENYSPEIKYDLIVSNATFQWIDDLGGLSEKLCSMLNTGGKVVFSTFGYQTYYELRESLNSLDPELNYSQKFFRMEEIIEILGERYNILKSDEEFLIEKFKSVIDFLKVIKGIGSNSALSGKKSFTKGKFKVLDEIYKEKHGREDSIDVTNHLIYMVLEKL